MSPADRKVRCRSSTSMVSNFLRVCGACICICDVQEHEMEIAGIRALREERLRGRAGGGEEKGAAEPVDESQQNLQTQNESHVQ
jgi:hypothetical protein